MLSFQNSISTKSYDVRKFLEIPVGFGFRVSELGFRVSGFGFRVQGFGEGLRCESWFTLIFSAVSLLFGAYRNLLHPMIQNGLLINRCLIKKINHTHCNRCKQSCKILSSKQMHKNVYNLMQILVDNLQQKTLQKHLYLSLQIVSSFTLQKTLYYHPQLLL